MNTAANSTGLRYWMLRVLQECDNVAADFRADPVHDLRVALRRCRSMADGMMAIDPDRHWKLMKKAGKALFQELGALRDTQIMMEWVGRLNLKQFAPISEIGPGAPASGDNSELVDRIPAPEALPACPPSPAATLLHILQSREADQRRAARAALEEFDRKQWRHWADLLPARAARTRPGSAVFKHLALERWTTARDLHVRALRNRSQIAFHTLRIGIKRFRYIVENFLPVEHKLWSDDLKHLQDLLGEVHDLDVLWATAVSCHIFPDESCRKVWHSRILQEREKRIIEYRQRTTGSESLWDHWRTGLPQGRQVQQLATRRMKLWARALDPDFVHSERVARRSLELYDGLVAAGLFNLRNGTQPDARNILYAAALLHDVGKSKGNKGHHKQSLELIKKHGAPLGWKPETLACAAVVARFHCGALPTRGHKLLRDLFAEEQKIVIRLSAILRLANALDSAHDGRVKRLTILKPTASGENHERRINGLPRKSSSLQTNDALMISAEGYLDGTPTAQAVAAERYLLETVLRRPVIVTGLKRDA